MNLSKQEIDTMNIDNDNMNVDIECCSICSNPLNETSQKLKCNHTFHYDCIYAWYVKTLQSYQTTKRECPYCRQDGGYLILPNNKVYENNIHCPSQQPKIMDTTQRCKAKTTTGKICKNKGYTHNNGYCWVHTKMIKNN